MARSGKRAKAARRRGGIAHRPAARTGGKDRSAHPPIAPERPAIEHVAGERPEEVTGLALVAQYALTECPSWTAGIKQGAVAVERREPVWPRTHLNPICERCGQIISEELGCPVMKNPERAMLELIRMKAPREHLHAEA